MLQQAGPALKDKLMAMEKEQPEASAGRFQHEAPGFK